MFSEEFQGWGESASRGIGYAQLDNAGTTGLTLPQPSNVDLGRRCAYQSGDLMVQAQGHPPAPVEDVISGFAVGPMSDAVHSPVPHIVPVYPQLLPTPSATTNDALDSDHPTFIVPLERQDKYKLKRRRHIFETDDDDEDIIGPNLDPNVPRVHPNRRCVRSVPYRIFLGH